TFAFLANGLPRRLGAYLAATFLSRERPAAAPWRLPCGDLPLTRTACRGALALTLRRPSSHANGLPRRLALTLRRPSSHANGLPRRLSAYLAATFLSRDRPAVAPFRFP